MGQLGTTSTDLRNTVLRVGADSLPTCTAGTLPSGVDYVILPLPREDFAGGG